MRYMLFVFLVFFFSIDLLAFEYSLTEKLIARVTGPLHFRLILQPLVAIITGIAHGKKDALDQAPPYLFNLFKHREDRKENLKLGLQAIWKPLLIGIVIDSVAQYMIFGFVRIIGAALMGFVLIALPYMIARGLSNRARKKA